MIKERITVLTAAGILAAGYTASETELEFYPSPESNQTHADCDRNPKDEAEHMDANPGDSIEDHSREYTLGVLDYRNEEGRPVFSAGATIRKLGNFVYEIATSEDDPGESTTINLREQAFSEVLEVSADYDAVLSARRDGGGYPSFTLTCLSDPELEIPQPNRVQPLPLTPEPLPSEVPRITEA